MQKCVEVHGLFESPSFDSHRLSKSAQNAPECWVAFRCSDIDPNEPGHNSPNLCFRLASSTSTEGPGCPHQAGSIIALAPSICYSRKVEFVLISGVASQVMRFLGRESLAPYTWRNKVRVLPSGFGRRVDGAAQGPRAVRHSGQVRRGQESDQDHLHELLHHVLGPLPGRGARG